MARELRQAEQSLRVISNTQQTNSAARKELAMVSPCSTCQNFTQGPNPSDPYRMTCPRRIWIDQQQQNPDDPTIVDPVLSLSGSTDSNTLKNPVADQNSSNYIVWVAAIEDNLGVNDSDGNQLTPGILDPNFNTLYIRCRMYPYVPDDHHDTVRATGAFQEKDIVIAEAHRVPPLNPTMPVNNATSGVYAATPIAGTVGKTSLAYKFKVQNPDDHALVGGC